MLAVTLGGLVAGSAEAVLYPDQRCEADRAKAAGNYASCTQKAMAKAWTIKFYLPQFTAAVGKCAAKYAAVWPRLQARAAGSGVVCDNDRFDTTVPGKVSDRLTALEWEIKTGLDGTANAADVHDADNRYVWSGPGGSGLSSANGTAFTTFFASVNGNPCFAGTCDWRLPTWSEIATIMTIFPTCASAPCIEPALGPTASSSYWTSTTVGGIKSFAWFADFSGTPFDFADFTGGPLNYTWKFQGDFHVRAVRGGL
jgi:hypothetical protein